MCKNVGEKYMSQSKKDSMKEVVVNTSVGIAGSFAINLLCLYLFTTTIAIAASTTILCTIFSLTRGYAIRRAFNSKLVGEKG
jgi:ABC-type spermidine/putrescine transport system permease subunit I